MGVTDNWDSVKKDLAFDVLEQYKTAFGVFVPGKGCTLVCPTELKHEPKELKELWDPIFAGGLPIRTPKICELAKEAASAFYSTLKACVKGDCKLIGFTTPISCAVMGKGVVRNGGKSAAALVEVNTPPVSSVIRFLMALLCSKKVVIVVSYIMFTSQMSSFCFLYHVDLGRCRHCMPQCGGEAAGSRAPGQGVGGPHQRFQRF